MAKTFVFLGSISALLAVAMGAFGAHALRHRLTADMLAVYQTGVQYHLFHALGLVAVGLLAQWMPQSGYLKWSGWLMLAGIVLFSGSLYTLAMSGIRGVGAMTPFGGAAFLVAWALMALAAVKGAA
jgi:uncharacterized membrane protein YgdD (TMEM256/DUF423 family)